MGELSLSELACKEHPCLSSSIVANFLKPAGVGVAKPSRCFSSNGLLPRYASQKVSASEVHGLPFFARIPGLPRKKIRGRRR
jgi:hypothetical protein